MEDEIVVGLDFGTTFSGAACALKSSPDNILIIEDWPGQREAQKRAYCKTSTSLWYVQNSSGAFILQDWGWPAVNKYKEAVEKAEKHKVRVKEKTVGLLKERFKLELPQEAEGNDRDFFDIHKITAHRATRDFLSKISEYILEQLTHNFGKFDKEKIKWALTVPASWSARTKDSLRIIAKEAGLTNGISPRVEIILEPEAAAVYCYHKTNVTLKKDDKIIIVEAGGGTVDVGVYQRLEDRTKTKEVIVTEGRDCGSSFIDREFEKYLFRKVPRLSDYRRRYPTVLPYFMQEWDGAKCAFRGDESNMESILIPHNLGNKWEATSQMPEGSCHLLKISSEDMKNIFRPVITQLIALVESQLEKAGGCKSMLVVGGFAESTYLISVLRNQFHGRVSEIIALPKPGAAICHGALLSVLHPPHLYSRVSRRTYGLRANGKFVNGKHSQDKLFFIGHVGWCRDIFLVFFKKGEHVAVNHVVTHELPRVEGQQEVDLEIFSSDALNPEYVDGCVLEGRVVFRPPADFVKPWKKLTVEMEVGKTNITVRGKIHYGFFNHVMPTTSTTLDFL